MKHVLVSRILPFSKNWFTENTSSTVKIQRVF